MALCHNSVFTSIGNALLRLVSPNHITYPFRSLHMAIKLQAEDCKRPVRQKSCGMAEIPKELMSPADKVAIVTGGSSGIGYSAACYLLSEGAKHVIINGIDQEDGESAIDQLEERYCDKRVTFVCGDVTDPCHFEGANPGDVFGMALTVYRQQALNQGPGVADIQVEPYYMSLHDLFKMACECHGGINIVFNNAGTSCDRNWENEVDVNVKGTILGTLLAWKYMGKDMGGKGGVVVNNSSILGLQSLPGSPMYSTTKHAIIGTVLNFGHPIHCKRTCVRVCGLCPGTTETELYDQAAKNKYTPAWGKEAERQLCKLPSQSPDVVGQGFMHIVKYAASGTVWVVEDSKLLHVNIPNRKSIMKKVTKFEC